MRKALIIGIDHYDHIGCLSGCINDAYSVKAVLERHADGTTNFTNPRMIIGASAGDVTKDKLKDAARELLRTIARSLCSTSPVMVHRRHGRLHLFVRKRPRR